MNYYIYMLVTLAVMLVVFKFIFCEIEAYNAKKRSILSWYFKLNESFKYVRTKSIILMGVFCYMIVSIQPFFSFEWFTEMIGFIAVAVICDGISQFVGYHYAKIRFKKDISNAIVAKNEILKAINVTKDELVQQSKPTYSSQNVILKYVDDDTHLATISLDGGEFISSFDKLPPITYVVESQYEKATEKLADKNVKVTHLTDDGKLPFKDERLDVVVSELANYDRYDLYRVVKPGGYILVDQMGSDNYREIMNIFLPFKIKGRWDLETGSKLLSEIGLEIVEGFEEHGFVRFNTLTSFITFMKSITRADITHDRFINFYGQVLKQIKEKSYFELTTHRFMVVAKKKKL